MLWWQVCLQMYVCVTAIQYETTSSSWQDVLMQLSCAAYVEHLQYADTLGYYWFL